MVRNCIAPSCFSIDDSPLVKLHRVPLKNLERQQKWMLAIKRKNFVPTIHSRVCSLHFRPCDYELTTPERDRLKLKKGAVPSVFSDSNLPPKREPTKGRKLLPISEQGQSKTDDGELRNGLVHEEDTSITMPSCSENVRPDATSQNEHDGTEEDWPLVRAVKVSANGLSFIILHAEKESIMTQGGVMYEESAPEVTILRPDPRKIEIGDVVRFRKTARRNGRKRPAPDGNEAPRESNMSVLTNVNIVDSENRVQEHNVIVRTDVLCSIKEISDCNDALATEVGENVSLCVATDQKKDVGVQTKTVGNTLEDTVQSLRSYKHRLQAKVLRQKRLVDRLKEKMKTLAANRAKSNTPKKVIGKHAEGSPKKKHIAVQTKTVSKARQETLQSLRRDNRRLQVKSLRQKNYIDRLERSLAAEICRSESLNEMKTKNADGYSDEITKIAVTLFLYSTDAYEWVQSRCPLPSLSQVRDSLCSEVDDIDTT